MTLSLLFSNLQPLLIFSCQVICKNIEGFFVQFVFLYLNELENYLFCWLPLFFSIFCGLSFDTTNNLDSMSNRIYFNENLIRALSRKFHFVIIKFTLSKPSHTQAYTQGHAYVTPLHFLLVFSDRNNGNACRDIFGNLESLLFNNVKKHL